MHIYHKFIFAVPAPPSKASAFIAARNGINCFKANLIIVKRIRDDDLHILRRLRGNYFIGQKAYCQTFKKIEFNLYVRRAMYLKKHTAMCKLLE